MIYIYICLLASLKSLHALLRSDDVDIQQRHITLANWHILRSHLLPLLITSCDNPLIIKHIIRLLCVMTMDIPMTCNNKTLRIQQLQAYKMACVEQTVSIDYSCYV